MALIALASQPARAQRLIWQSDLQLRAVTLVESNGNLTLTVVMGTELGEATAARLEVMLPVGVGLVQLGSGCVAGPSPPGVPSLRARVTCTAGTLRPRDVRQFSVTTTSPPAGMERRFGVMATSDTPDPKPSNNFAERMIPNRK